MSERQPIDTHAHIIDPERFAYADDAPYHPVAAEYGPLERYLAVLDAHAIGHAVIVQPTNGYRFDNAVTLDAVARGRGRLRAVVKIDPDRVQSDETLLDHDGVAGARLDLMGEGSATLTHPGNLRLLAALRERNKTLVVQAERDQVADALPILGPAGAVICVDHCGRPDPRLGVRQRGFEALLELGRQGHAVKLSGAFRFSREAPPFRDAQPFVAELLRVFTPARCCWGSDWPYLRAVGRTDYEQELRLLQACVPDAAARTMILTDTPRRVFGFAAS